MQPSYCPIGLPESLTKKSINKWFNNSCEACKASSLSQKPVENDVETKYTPGECFAMDIETFDEDSLGFQRNAMVRLDVGSDKSLVSLLRNKANFHAYVDKVRRMYLGKSHKLKVLIVDKAFLSTVTIEYCKEHQTNQTTGAL